MDSVLIANPVQTLTSTSDLEIAWQVATILIAAVSLVSLYLTGKQIIQSSAAMADAAKTNEMQRQDIQEQHRVRLREIMPWFVADTTSKSDEIIFKNIGGRATSVSVNCNWMKSRAMSKPAPTLSNGVLSVRLETVPRDGLLPVATLLTNTNGPLISIPPNEVECSFTLTFSDDLGNRYSQQGAWQDSVGSAFFTRDPESILINN